jgi:hypothetical protein
VIDVEPLIRAQLEGLMPLPEGSRRDWADVLARSGRRHRRSRRRLVIAVAVGVCVLAIAGAAIAAGLGAFSGTTITQIKACAPSTTTLTTAGAQVLTGHTEVGVYCIAYKDPKGATAGSAAKLGDTPVGPAVAVKALDTASQRYVIAGVVPVGYDLLRVGSTEVPIENQAFVVDASVAGAPAELSGPAGTTSINLRALASG